MSHNRTVDFKQAKRALEAAGWRIVDTSKRWIRWEGPGGESATWVHLVKANNEVPIRDVIAALGHNPFGRPRAKPWRVDTALPREV